MALESIALKTYVFLFSVAFSVTLIMYFSLDGWTGVLRSKPTTLALIFTWMILISICLLLTARRDVEVNNDTLEVRTSFYGTKMNIKNLDHVDILEKDQRIPKLLMINGISLPWIYSGWFESPDGKFLVDFISKPNMLIKEKGGEHNVLLQVKNPEEFKKILEEIKFKTNKKTS